MRHLPLILITAALFAGEAEATPPAGPPGKDKRPPGPLTEELFHRADADADGKVTLVELTTAMETRQKIEREAVFTRIDSNGDGTISKEEFVAFEPLAPPGEKKRRGPDPAEMFKRLDRNGDGAITVDEVKRPKAQE